MPEQKSSQNRAEAATQLARKKNNELKTTNLSQKVGYFIEQMIVSVICEPSLSQSLLEMEGSLADLATENFSLEKLKKLLSTISEREFVGLTNFKGRENTSEVQDLSIGV